MYACKKIILSPMELMRMLLQNDHLLFASEPEGKALVRDIPDIHPSVFFDVDGDLVINSNCGITEQALLTKPRAWFYYKECIWEESIVPSTGILCQTSNEVAVDLDDLYKEYALITRVEKKPQGVYIYISDKGTSYLRAVPVDASAPYLLANVIDTILNSPENR